MSLTLNEQERQAYILGDTITADLLGKVINYEEQKEKLPDMQEIFAQFPEEDFLCGAMSMLRELSKSMRGHNKEIVKGIIDELDNIQLQQARATEYAKDCLK